MFINNGFPAIADSAQVPNALSMDYQQESLRPSRGSFSRDSEEMDSCPLPLWLRAPRDQRVAKLDATYYQLLGSAKQTLS